MHVFHTKSREGLVNLTHGIGLTLNPALKKTQLNKPLIITVDGSSDAGKSLIWDEMIAKLLGESAEKIEERGTEPSHRIGKSLAKRSFEIWEGENRLGGKDRLKVMVCNAARNPGGIPALDYLLDRYLDQKEGDDLPVSNIVTLGDVLIVSNRVSQMSDLHIELERSQRFPREEWDRVVGVQSGKVIGRSKEYKSLIRSASHSIAPGADLQ